MKMFCAGHWQTRAKAPKRTAATETVKQCEAFPHFYLGMLSRRFFFWAALLPRICPRNFTKLTVPENPPGALDEGRLDPNILEKTGHVAHGCTIPEKSIIANRNRKIQSIRIVSLLFVTEPDLINDLY